MKKVTIAIDGYSSTGKSTIAKQLAKKMQYIYVDSGAMYRAVALFALEYELIGENIFLVDKLIKHLPKINLSFKYNQKLEFAEIYLNEKNVEQKIRSLEVSNFVSLIAEISEVRKKLVQIQQKMGINKGVVMDGRDIGTVVFPEAEIKLFITASVEKRAKRRYDELINKGDNVSYEEILKNVQERDFIDVNRADSPLVKATDAIEIDNTNLNLKEQFELIYAIVLKKIKSL